MSIEFLLTSIVVVLLPGTGVVYTLAIGLGRGFRASIAAALGCTLGILPAALASIVGLAAIFHTSAVAFTLIKYAGAAYLLYMAWSILRDNSALTVSAERAPVSLRRIATSGLLINILNPKLSLFFLAFLPQFVSFESANATAMMLIHALVFMAITFVSFVGYGACAALARDYVISRPNVLSWLKRGFAGTFGFLGLRLALTEN
ncbi:LysE family translocator [Pelagibacterium xiamenense]|uniref:LysE family translocator n=1 Tax=Pelagibacterium xiamenense TaxID=2901140 RepID=UPI001E356E06|nr:LysE family translocator [Pelagibacterium xiamenense]MCD7061063.1 LysE family translocator [Pelagibacterium xiamenense]